MRTKQVLWVVGSLVAAVVVSSALQAKNWAKRAPGESGQALGGCGGPMSVTAHGQVRLADGIAGATVSLKDDTGRVLLEVPAATDARGFFTLEVPLEAGSHFLVAATGGTHRGEAFADTLLADVEGFGARRAPLYVNAATTLAALYRSKQPGTSVKDAQAHVRKVLDLPPSYSLGASLANPRQERFSHHALDAAFRAAGAPSLTSYLEERLVTFGAEGTPQRFVASATPVAAQAQLGAKSAAHYVEKFVKWALGEAVGETIDWGFQMLLSKSGQGAAAEIREKLEELRQEIADLQSEVLSALDQQIVVAKAQDADEAATTIQYYGDQLAFFAERCQPACSTSNIQGYLQVLQEASDPTTGVQPAIRRISEVLTHVNRSSGDDTPGLIAAAVARYRGHTDFTPPPNPHVQSLVTYYQGAQVLGFKVLLEVQQHGLPLDPLPDSPSDPFPSTGFAKEFQTFLRQQKEALDRAQQGLAATGTVRFKEMVWMQRPVTGLSFDAGRLETNFNPQTYTSTSVRYADTVAKAYCESLAAAKFGGLDGWHLPSVQELDEVMEGAPKGGKTEATGYFHWLEERGFHLEPVEGPLPRDGFIFGAAYLSSRQNGLSGHYYDALWNDDLYYACVARVVSKTSFGKAVQFNPLEPCGSEHVPHALGAWCVTKAPEHHE